MHISSSGSSYFQSPIKSNVSLSLHNFLHVPCIAKNLISVNRFAKDNSVFFKFHSDFYLVKSQATKEVLLRGIVDHDGLYQFPSLHLQPQSKLFFPAHCLVSNSSFQTPVITNSNVQKKRMRGERNSRERDCRWERVRNRWERREKGPRLIIDRKRNEDYHSYQRVNWREHKDVTSFYFSRFPEETTEKDLWRHFKQVGDVREIFISPKRNKI